MDRQDNPTTPPPSQASEHPPEGPADAAAPPRVPSAEELHRLARLCTESGRKTSVQLGSTFARRKNYAEPQAPLAELLRAGGASLKLYLTLVMMTRTPPHELFRDTSAEAFALTLGFEAADQGSGSGTRRINRALRALERLSLIDRTPRPGRHPLIKVHHYRQQTPYITLPLELWRHGWINVLSASSLAVYVALRLEEVGRPGTFFHIRPFDQELYGMSSETWRRGASELSDLNLIEISNAHIEDRSLVRRRRRIYRLLSDRITRDRPA